MGFFDKLIDKLSAGSIEHDHLILTVRCKKCGENIQSRINLNNDLSLDNDNGKERYICNKGVMGSGETRCYEKFELILYFDKNRKYLNCDVVGNAEVISVS